MDRAPSIAALFSRFGKWSFRSPDPSALSAAELGPLGEKVAARHLRRHGYRVLYRNFRAPRGGEVDIVCRDKRAKTLVFVEVKTRRTLDFGQPNEAVDRAKQELIARGALAWLKLLGHPDILFRFDIAEVVFEGRTPRVNVIQNAFVLPAPYIY
jgi:putative endonuclease